MAEAVRVGQKGLSLNSPQQLDTHLEWVRSIVGTLIRRMDLPVTEFDELVSAGYLGLVEAADRFDASKGNRFEAFANLRVRGAILDAVRKNCDLSARGYRYAKALQAATDIRAQSPSDAKGTPAATLSRALDCVAKGAIAFRLSFDDVESEVLSKSTQLDAETALQKKEEQTALRSCVSDLPELERQVVKAYYYENKTVNVIADELGVTKGWVSKVHKKALSKLQEALGTSLS